jgi:hypothetical protein
LELPTLEDIMKLRQSPRNSRNAAFTFVVENLAGAVIGQRKRKTTRCYAPISKHMTTSDEAFMLLVLENQYDLWIKADSNKVGRGKYTENGPNRKFCGWTNEGMRRFNTLVSEVRDNRNKQYCDEVEDMTQKALAVRHKAKMKGSSKNNRKRRRHSTEISDQYEEGDDDNDDKSVIPDDDLCILATQLEKV